MYWATGRLLQMEEERSLQGYYKARRRCARKQDEVKLVQEENQEFLFVCIRHRIYLSPTFAAPGIH